MNKTLMIIVIIFALSACTSDVENCTPGDESATFLVTFDSTWSADTHPTDFPSNPHFSALVGLTHNSNFLLWQPSGTATDGIESMAETGGTSTLATEISAAISAGSGGTLTNDAGGIGTSPGSASTSFTTTNEYTLVSLVSMIAPSPDWFVGVNSLDLCENNAWQQSVTASLQPYDAGTDSGSTFQSDDADVTPHQPISEITGFPFLNNDAVAPVGTFTFELQ